MAGYWRAAGWLLGIAAVLYAALLGGMYAFQRNLLYRPDTSKPDWTDLDLPTLQEIELIASDGVRLFAWYVPPSAGRPVIVYFHGNGGNIADRADRMLYFAAAQFGVLIVEYRGYGGNPGSPSEAGLFADARAGLDFLKSERIASGRIVLYGESLGTGVAVRMASERPVALLLLESPYASMAAVAQRHYPYVPVAF